jgi:quercetin dioxygenase-like cupin family protein
MQVKSFNSPDETKTPPKTKVEEVKLPTGVIMRDTFEPGWKWSEHIKPVIGTDSCQVHHVAYVESGRLTIVSDDGTKIDMGPGDVADIPPGHDAWVVGDEPVVFIDFGGSKT